jgi:hypothetical protein
MGWCCAAGRRPSGGGSREPLGIELISPAVFEQKLNYIHCNPVRAGLCINPEEYYYSSAKFYYDGVDSCGMLTHYSGN